MTTNIYILRLQGGRYYVGKTDNPIKRYQEHLNGAGSAWTRTYKPIGVEKIIEKASPFDEDRYVKEYMNKHGIDKVRGGAYVTEELPEFQEEALKSELWGATDKCTTCGRKGHWAKNCFAQKDITGKEICEESEDDIIICVDCDKEFTSDFAFNGHTCKPKNNKKSTNKPYTKQYTKPYTKSYSKSSGACFRCGRQGHYADECYAGTNKKGYALDSDDDY